ncbi:hypothetical protein [Sporosarcina sp. Te-1]|uniref:hypothetical protein n=1 Tax=Sporosarcina sp. Te-1 TaxID=2818390 RepID=UPI001A9F20C4|nr:hypothetical protein [Sporosarcina sp. Te-1]QTD42053.1 hypothetical protein J3U78_04250 [Sporosarcina sp. Te-1]
MKVLKRYIICGFAATVVLLAGCEKEEKVVADPAEPVNAEEVDQAEETAVDEYWSQPIDSELCQTVGECRDLGDAYGSEYFTSFLGDLNDAANQMTSFNKGTENDNSVFAANERKEEIPIIARYEIKEDKFVLTSGEEESIFIGIADLVLALFDRNKANLQILDFQEDVYPHVNSYQGKLVLPSNMITHWLQSYTVVKLVHEYGHLLTWNEADFVISETCPADQYYSKPHGGECYKAESYINLYYHAFWKDYEEQWLQSGYETVEEKIAFYEEHKESFVTTYASTHPYEDIAESFGFFMLTPYNDSPQTVAEEKVNFFYQFPELVEYRTFVLKELKDRKDEMWSFY